MWRPRRRLGSQDALIYAGMAEHRYRTAFPDRNESEPDLVAGASPPSERHQERVAMGAECFHSLCLRRGHPCQSVAVRLNPDWSGSALSHARSVMRCTSAGRSAVSGGVTGWDTVGATRRVRGAKGTGNEVLENTLLTAPALQTRRGGGFTSCAGPARGASARAPIPAKTSPPPSAGPNSVRARFEW